MLQFVCHARSMGVSAHGTLVSLLDFCIDILVGLGPVVGVQGLVSKLAHKISQSFRTRRSVFVWRARYLAAFNRV